MVKSNCGAYNNRNILKTSRPYMTTKRCVQKFIPKINPYLICNRYSILYQNCKALVDIVSNIYGMTQDEWNEVYWVVCEPVKNRLDKAGSV